MRPYKYKINQFLRQMPKGLSPADLAYLLELDFHVSPRIFDRDRGLKWNDPAVIPPDRLRIYAFLFQVEVDQLKNLETPVN